MDTLGSPRRNHGSHGTGEIFQMADLLTLENASTLVMLILLQAVLGFDNLLYISIESNRVEEKDRPYVRKLGIIMAVVLRIVLLLALVAAIKYFQEPFFSVHLGIIEAEFNVHAFIVLLGGIFILYTAMKEILHLLAVNDIEHSANKSTRSVASDTIELESAVQSIASARMRMSGSVPGPAVR